MPESTIKILEKHITPNFKQQKTSTDGTSDQKVLKLKKESIKLVSEPKIDENVTLREVKVPKLKL